MSSVASVVFWASVVHQKLDLITPFPDYFSNQERVFLLADFPAVKYNFREML